ncbi:MAG TPA: VWA domain-containing protein [Bryobacteraceae bacterium]|nr:VWA domain-containing protein [Bryobacteraceae bacterium]
MHAAPYSPAPASGVIRTQVELVEVPTVVRDSKGVAIAGLQRGDFELFDGGKKQEISMFSVETLAGAGAPGESNPGASHPTAGAAEAVPEPHRRYLALVFDDLNTDPASLRSAKTAGEKFVAEALNPGDLVAIFTTAMSQTVEFTADVAKLRQAIETITLHTGYADDLHTCPVIRAYEAYLIGNHLDPQLLQAKAAEAASCYHIPDMDSAVRLAESRAEAVWREVRVNSAHTLGSISAIVAAVGKMPGQRLVLLVSSGFVSGGAEQELEAVSDAALRSGVIVSGMDLRGLYTVVPGGDASTPLKARAKDPAEIAVQVRTEDAKDDGMAELTSATGGRLFRNNNDLGLGFRRLAAAPEVLYLLGFTPRAALDGKYHPLKVRLTGGHHGAVEARTGYHAISKATPGDSPRTNRDQILLGTVSRSEIAARITAEPSMSSTGPRVVMKAWIDVSRLNFETRNTRRTQKLTMIAALVDGGGDFVVGRQAVADLALKDHSFAALSAAGLTVSLSLHAPSGSYTLRVLVQEALTGKMTAVSQPVRLP